MGDQETLEMLLKARNDTNKAFDEAINKLKVVDGTAKNTNSSLKGLTKGFADISGAMNVAGMVASKVNQVYDEVITKTMEWGNLVEDTGRLIGENADQTSRLIVAGRSLGIQQQTLTLALETAISRGVRPNIDGLMKLADEYTAIQDPLQQSAFLMSTFGRRAGPEMAELLGQGRAGLQQFLTEAERTGMVIDGTAVAAAERYQIANEKLQQRLDGIAVTIGNTVLPAASVLIDTMMRTSDVINDQNLNWLTSIPLLGQVAQGYLAVANGIQAAKDMELELIAAQAREQLNNERFGNAGGQHHQYASNLQSNTGRGNLYTGTVYTPPGRAAGGPVWAGMPRMVGENGPEWFNPERSGTIDSAPAGGGGVSIGELHFHINGGDPREVRRVVEQTMRDLQAVGRL